MIAKVTQRTEFGPVRALPTARRARVERGNRLRPTRSCAWIAVVEAHQVVIRSSFHSSMKTENWFQLRVVGVTGKSPVFGPGSFYARTAGLDLPTPTLHPSPAPRTRSKTCGSWRSLIMARSLVVFQVVGSYPQYGDRQTWIDDASLCSALDTRSACYCACLDLCRTSACVSAATEVDGNRPRHGLVRIPCLGRFLLGGDVLSALVRLRSDVSRQASSPLPLAPYIALGGGGTAHPCRVVSRPRLLSVLPGAASQQPAETSTIVRSTGF
jgi:hypothetical protein